MRFRKAVPMAALKTVLTMMMLSVALGAQTVLAQEASASLAAALKPGQLVIVTDASRKETKGIVKEATGTLLTLEGLEGLEGREGPEGRERGLVGKTFAASDIYTVRKTDPLGNGTGIGAGVGVGLTVAMFASCGRYEYSEESGLCTAGAVLGGAFAIGLGAFIGRQIDRAVGEREVYRHAPERTTRVSLGPVWRAAGPGVALFLTHGFGAKRHATR